ncbi:MAG: beta strand repeat-containing protein [Halobacteriaceae archaeon]
MAVDTSSGIPTLDLGPVSASYASGSGSDTLQFSYTVQSGDSGTISLGDITLNSGTITDNDQQSKAAGLAASSQSLQSAYIDTNSLSVSIGSPSDGADLASHPTISGTASDDNSVSSVEVSIQNSNGNYWDGTSWVNSQTWLTATGTTDWSFDTANAGISSDDTYTVTARATDSAGNTQTSPSVTYTVDTTRPSANIDSPTGSSFVTVQSGGSVTVQYDASDAGSSVSDVTVRITDGNGNTVVEKTGLSGGTDASTTLSIPSPQADGSYNVELVVTDGAGNTDTVTESGAVVVDDVVSGVSVGDSVVQPSATLSVTGTADTAEDVTFRLTDSNGDTATVTKTISSTSYSVSIDLSSLTFSGDGLSDGSVTLAAEQDSGASFSSEASTSFTVDSNSLSVSIGSPSDDALLTSHPTVSGTASDDNSVSSVEVSIQNSNGNYWDGNSWVNSQTWVAASGTTSWSFDTANAGISSDDTYTVTARATDSAGNMQTSSSVTYTVDTTAPTVDSAVTADTNDDGAVETIDVTFSEPIDDSTSTLGASTFGLTSGTIESVDTGASADDAKATITVSGLSSTGVTPDVTLKAGTVKDAAGNSLSSDQAPVTPSDGAEPVITASSATVNDNGDIDVSFTASETLSGGEFSASPAVGTVSVQFSDLTESGTEYTYTHTPSYEGTYSFTLANPTDGSNAATSSVTVSAVKGDVESGNITATPNGKSQQAVHSVNITVAQSVDAQTYEIVYSNTDISDVDNDDIRALGIDANGDGDVTDAGDTNFLDSGSPASGLNQVSGGSNGHVLTLDTSSSAQVEAGETIYIEYGNVTNPSSSGPRDVTIRVNPSTPAVEFARPLSIGADVPSVTQVTLDGTPVTNGPLGPSANGTDVPVVIEFSEAMDTSVAPSATLTVAGQEVALNNGTFFDGATAWKADADVSVENAEVDASVSVTDAVDADDGNHLASDYDETVEIDTAPLGIKSANTVAGADSAHDATTDTHAVEVTFNDSVSATSLATSDFALSTGSVHSLTGDTDGDETVTLVLSSDVAPDATPTVSIAAEQTVTDDAGNANATGASVTATDAVAPDATVKTEVSGDQVTVYVDADEALASDTIEVNLTLTEKQTVVATVSGFTAVSGDSSNYTATATVADGYYTAKLVAAEDANGNAVPDTPTASALVDTSAPTFSLAQPSADLVASVTKDKIKVDIADATGVDASTVYATVSDSEGTAIERTRAAAVDTDAVSFAEGTLTIDVSGVDLADGTVDVAVEAADAAGRSNSTTLSFELDSSAASGLTIKAPTESLNLTSSDTLDVAYNYSDTNPQDVTVKLVDGGTTYTYAVNDSQYADDGARKSLTIDLDALSDGELIGPNLADGTYKVVVEVTDSADNLVTAETAALVTVDDTAPAVENWNVVDTSDAQTNVSVDVSDATSGVDASSIALTVDDADSTTTYTLSDAGLQYEDGTLTFVPAEAGVSFADGDVTFDVAVEDNSGNHNSAETTVTINDAAPTIDRVEAEAGENVVTVHFSEDVTAADGTISADDFAYTDVSGDGAVEITSVTPVDLGADSYTNKVELTLDAPVATSDLGADEVNARQAALVDREKKNVKSTDAATVALTDTSDPAAPAVSAGTITADAAGSYTVELTFENPASVSTVDVAVTDGSTTVSEAGVTVDQSTETVTLDVTSLSDGQVDVTVTAHDAGVERSTQTTVEDVTKDTQRPTLTVTGNAGSSWLELQFSEPVSGAGDLGNYVFENLSASEIYVDDDTYYVELNEPVPVGGIASETVTVSATSAITDANGTAASTSEVQISDVMAPSAAGATSENGSTTVTLHFSEAVFNSSGGALTADDVAYVNNSGTDKVVESVDHAAGDRVATVTLNESLAPSDLSSDALSLTIEDSVGTESEVSATIRDVPRVSEFGVSSATGQNVTVSFLSDTELSTITVDLSSEGDLSELDAPLDDGVVTLTESDFSVTAVEGGYEYTATVSVPRDGRYAADLKSVQSIGGTMQTYDDYERDSLDTTVVDTGAPEPVDAEIVDAGYDATEIAVQFDEPVFDEGARLIVDGEIMTADSERSGAGEVTFTVEGHVETADLPPISTAGVYEMASADDTYEVDTSATTALDTLELHLSKGSNFVSVPVEYGKLEIAGSAFDTSELRSIMTYDAGSWHSYNPAKPTSEQDLTALRGGQGYIVNVSADVTLDVTVRNAEPGSTAGEATPGQRQLEEGWNLVGHWQEGAQPIGIALGTIRGSVDPELTDIYGQKMPGQFAYESVETFQPGEAYWVFVEDDEVYAAANFEAPIWWDEEPRLA